MVRQDLSLDMSCTNFDYDAVVQALAVQYDIDSSLISFDDPCASASRRRGRKLASLRITIEIATPPPDLSGSAPVTTAASILSSMNSVSMTALASSIGAALGTTVNVTQTSAPTQTTEERTVTVVCPKGKWVRKPDPNQLELGALIRLSRMQAPFC